MATKSRYYLVEHMCGPTIIKTNDKRKIATWLKNFYKDGPEHVAQCEVEDHRADVIDLFEID